LQLPKLIINSIKSYNIVVFSSHILLFGWKIISFLVLIFDACCIHILDLSVKVLGGDVPLHFEGWSEKIVFVGEWIPQKDEILWFFKTVEVAVFGEHH